MQNQKNNQKTKRSKESRLQNTCGSEILRTIAEGTASVTGDDFFRSVVYNIASALRVRYAFVAKFVNETDRVRTLAFWNVSGFINNFELDLPGSPCEKVLRGEIKHYPKHVQILFPKDEILVKFNAESYLAVPLINTSGRVLGHLAVFDTKPMPAKQRDFSIFKIFAARVTAELERQYALQEVYAYKERLGRILATASDAIITIDTNQNILLFNQAAERILRFTAQEALNQKFDKFLTEGFRKILAEYFLSNDQCCEPVCNIWASQGITALRADKKEFPVEAALSKFDDHGQTLCTIMLRDINDRKRLEEEKQELERVNVCLQEEVKSEYDFDEIIGQSVVFKNVLKDVESVANTDSSVLIIGETGTGKELIARAIHNLSARSTKPLIKVNCAALPLGLVESEFFGHEKGAFTGAIQKKMGRFELAHGGSIFLDEIGDVPLDVQVKLLRVLQEQEFERVGGTKTKKVDVRLIAATNMDLSHAVKEKHFRADLFYRLNVFPINIPPLRNRKKDIPLLVHFLVNKLTKKLRKKIKSIDMEMIKVLTDYDWPGNIRELSNIIERAIILSNKPILTIGKEGLFRSVPEPVEKQKIVSLTDVEHNHILKILGQTSWVIEGHAGAAQLLGLRPSTLRNRMQKLGISRKTHHIRCRPPY